MSDTSWLIDRVVYKLMPGLDADEVKAILLQYGKMKEWVAKLDGCNFSMARDDIRAALEMRDREAIETGGSYYYNPEFISTLEDFNDNLNLESAIDLLEIAPYFMPMFEMNSTHDPLFNMLERLRQKPGVENHD